MFLTKILQKSLLLKAFKHFILKVTKVSFLGKSFAILVSLELKLHDWYRHNLAGRPISRVIVKIRNQLGM